jgi:threonine dehydrogenase-like Zn-dependent dehydrogenase
MNYSAPWPGPEWTTAVWMLKTGLIKTDALATHQFPLDEFQKGLDVILDGNELFVKIMITPGDGV